MDGNVIKKCKEYDIDPLTLTQEEMRLLREEIEAEQNGEIFTDSVLDNPDIHLRVALGKPHA